MVGHAGYIFHILGMGIENIDRLLMASESPVGRLRYGSELVIVTKVMINAHSSCLPESEILPFLVLRDMSVYVRIGVMIVVLTSRQSDIIFL